MPTTKAGLYRKYEIRRTDGGSEPGGKHEHCPYFVLDLEHDRYALAALRAYADACEQEMPALADDLRSIISAVPASDQAREIMDDNETARSR
jgi:hypothetical protein